MPNLEPWQLNGEKARRHFFFLPFGQPRASVTMVLHVIEAGIQYVKERKN